MNQNERQVNERQVLNSDVDKDILKEIVQNELMI